MRRRDHFDKQGCNLYINTWQRDVNIPLAGGIVVFFARDSRDTARVQAGPGECWGAGSLPYLDELSKAVETRIEKNDMKRPFPERSALPGRYRPRGRLSFVAGLGSRLSRREG